MLLGLNGFSATLAAYYGALVHGEGDWLDLSAQQCAAGMLELYGPRAAFDHLPAPRLGNRVHALWGIFPCADGFAGVCALQRQAPAFLNLTGDPAARGREVPRPGAAARPADRRRARRGGHALVLRQAQARGAGARREAQGADGRGADAARPAREPGPRGARVLRRGRDAERCRPRAGPPVPRVSTSRPASCTRRPRTATPSRATGWSRAREEAPARRRAHRRPVDDVGRAVRDPAARRDGRGGDQDRVAARVGQRAHAPAPARRARALEQLVLLQRLQPRQEVAHARPRAAARARALPRARREVRRGDRELPRRRARQAGHRLGRARAGQARHRPRQHGRLRQDRPRAGAGRLRTDHRADGRHGLDDRLRRRRDSVQVGHLVRRSDRRHRGRGRACSGADRAPAHGPRRLDRPRAARDDGADDRPGVRRRVAARRGARAPRQPPSALRAAGRVPVRRDRTSGSRSRRATTASGARSRA